MYQLNQWLFLDGGCPQPHRLVSCKFSLFKCYSTFLTQLRLAIPKPSRMLPFYVLVCTFSLMTTLTQLPFYCSVTAVIAEHSFFLWKQKPSASLDPFKLAIQKLNLSADLTKIKTTIKEASHLKTKDKKYALVKIALENRLGEFLIFQVFQCPSLIFYFSFIREKASFQNFIIAIHVSSYHCYDAILPLVLKKTLCII